MTTKTPKQRAIESLEQLTDNDGPIMLGDQKHVVKDFVDHILAAAKEPDPGLCELRQQCDEQRIQIAALETANQALREDLRAKLDEALTMRGQVQTLQKVNAEQARTIDRFRREVTELIEEKTKQENEQKKQENEQNARIHDMNSASVVLARQVGETLADAARRTIALYGESPEQHRKAERDKWTRVFERCSKDTLDRSQNELAKLEQLEQQNHDYAGIVFASARLCSQVWATAARKLLRNESE